MDRAVLLKHLVQAENVVLLGQLHVQRQRQIVAELERNGQDSSRSRNLLGLFEEMLATHHDRYDLLRDRLAFEEVPGSFRQARLSAPSGGFGLALAESSPGVGPLVPTRRETR
jgi:hypothetical protein